MRCGGKADILEVISSRVEAFRSEILYAIDLDLLLVELWFLRRFELFLETVSRNFAG